MSLRAFIKLSKNVMLICGSGVVTLAGDWRGQTYEWGAEVDVNRRYYWAGMPQWKGPSVNPSWWGRLGAWHAELFLNVGLTGDPNRKRLDLIDLSVARSWKKGPLEVAPGVEFYFNRPGSLSVDPHTAEFATRVALTWGVVEVAAVNAADVMTYPGAYRGEITASTQRRWRKTEFRLSGKVGWASADFNRTYVGFSRTAPTFVGAEFSIRRSLGRHSFVRPHLELRRLLGPEMREAFSGAPGWSLGVAFGMN